MTDQPSISAAQQDQPGWHPFIPMPVAAARAAQAGLRAACPVAEVMPGLLYVFSAAEARKALLDHKGFSNVGNFGGDPAMPPFVTLLDPPLHSEVRAMLNAGFTRGTIVDAGPWIGEIVDELLDALGDARSADIVAQLALPLTERVISRLVGIPSADSATLAQWSLAITAMLPRPDFHSEEWRRIEAYIGTLLAERAGLAEQPDDMITRLSTATIERRPLTTREITGHVWLLFIGGLETTAYTLSILIHELLADRSQWERLLGDRALLPNAIEEGLRIASPFRAIERQVTGDGELGGCPVHKGQVAFIGLESANLDEALFGADAARYRADRADAGRHIAFGLGRHTCLGAPLARSEMLTVLEKLLDRLPGLRLAPDFRFETVPSQFSHIPKSVEVIW